MKNNHKRKEVMQAALELIAEHGFHGAPMAMIADQAGVGAGTIYRYFESKDVLISELYRELEEKLLSFLKEGYSTQIPSGIGFFTSAPQSYGILSQAPSTSVTWSNT